MLRSLLFFRGSWRHTALQALQCVQSRAASRSAWAICSSLLPCSSGRGGLQRQVWQPASPVVAEGSGPVWLDAKRDLPAFFGGWPWLNWTSKPLRRLMGPQRFAVVLPGAGLRLQMKLRDFLTYAAVNCDFFPPRWDAEPLYLFESQPPRALRACLREPSLSSAPNIARSCPALREVLAEATRGWLLIGGGEREPLPFGCVRLRCVERVS